MDFDVAMTILRLAVGSIFLAHGLQKLFGWFGGSGISGTAQMMESLHLRPPRLHAVFAGGAETLGGVLLLLGFLMPLAALAVVAVMATAIATVHLHKGFFNSNGGYEFNLTLVAAVLALACVGPGWLSLDNLVGINLAGWTWALAALIVGACGSSLAIAVGRHTGEGHHMEPAPQA